MALNPFRGLRRKEQTGFIYVADERQDFRFATAQPGDVIRNPTREAPWMVVERTLEDVLVTSWPGALWEAKVIDALQPQGHTGNYTRAVAVQLVRRLPSHILFGPNGEGVAWILDRASTLGPEEATLLYAHRSADAGRLYSKAWLNWGGLTAEKQDFEDWEGIVSVPGQVPVSPIHRGLNTVFGCVVTQALDTDGETAMYADGGPEDDPDLHLAEPWRSAALALIEAAMAFGAPDLLPDSERDVLTIPWRRLTGPGLS